VHGDEDQVIGISGGEATAAAIPGARLLTVPGLGHELPPGFWPILADALVELADRGARHEPPEPPANRA
jgi:pimeloyl-ACP methyl ester carboxylesterase